MQASLQKTPPSTKTNQADRHKLRQIEIEDQSSMLRNDHDVGFFGEHSTEYLCRKVTSNPSATIGSVRREWQRAVRRRKQDWKSRTRVHEINVRVYHMNVKVHERTYEADLTMGCFLHKELSRCSWANEATLQAWEQEKEREKISQNSLETTMRKRR